MLRRIGLPAIVTNRRFRRTRPAVQAIKHDAANNNGLCIGGQACTAEITTQYNRASLYGIVESPSNTAHPFLLVIIILGSTDDMGLEKEQNQRKRCPVLPPTQGTRGSAHAAQSISQLPRAAADV